MGDFNYPNINWSYREYTRSISGNFIDFCEDIFLNQYVEEGTRGGNTLNLIFFLNEEIIENLSEGKFWT